MTASNLSQTLIEQGLRRPASRDPLADAGLALDVASKILGNATMMPPGADRDLKLTAAAGHVQSALHYLAAARVRQEGRS